MISNQVKELREYAEYHFDEVARLTEKAADTIEALYTKLQAANIVRTEEYFKANGVEEYKDYIDRLKLNSRMIQDDDLKFLLSGAANEMEILLWRWMANMDRSAPDCGGGWIPCKERLPEEKGWYLVYAKNQRPFVAYFKGKTFQLNNHYHEIIAWMSLPEPYHEP